MAMLFWAGADKQTVQDEYGVGFTLNCFAWTLGVSWVITALVPSSTEYLSPGDKGAAAVHGCRRAACRMFASHPALTRPACCRVLAADTSYVIATGSGQSNAYQNI